MGSSLDNKCFILGVGAQKAGTSWLHDYLERRPEVFMPSPWKELHYFDARYCPDLCSHFDDVYRDLAAARLRVLSPPWSQKVRGRKQAAWRVRMISEPEAYRAYFERYVPKRCRLFGEITPSYSLLPVAGFEDVARRFNEVKVIFLMRDPVERVYSQLRMHKRNGTAHSDGEAAFLKALEDPVYLERGYYHKTLTRLYSVFSRDRVFTGFYENLFSDAEVARLCDFLGIPFQPGAYGKMINAAPERTALAPHLVAEARARFAEAYDFCFTEFGERVPESWRRD